MGISETPGHEWSAISIKIMGSASITLRDICRVCDIYQHTLHDPYISVEYTSQTAADKCVSSMIS